MRGCVCEGGDWGAYICKEIFPIHSERSFKPVLKFQTANCIDEQTKHKNLYIILMLLQFESRQSRRYIILKIASLIKDMFHQF